MEKIFTFESDHFPSRSNPDLCRRFEIIVEIRAYAEDAANVGDITVYDTEADREPFSLEHFPEGERKRIEKRADDLAYEFAREAWDERMIDEGDWIFDSMKDGDRE